jgi:hypothetical protein
MPPVLPDSLARLLSLLRGGFTAPTFDTFCWLVHGFIGRIGEHTITGVWQAARLGGVFHHSRAHDFFARRRWSPDRLGLWLCDFVVSCFILQDAPIAVAVDDTLFSRTGRRVFGAGWMFEQNPPKGRITPRFGYGNSFVCLGILGRLRGGERTICLPLLFRLWRAVEGGPTKIDLGHQLIELFAARFACRRIELVADSYYATRKLATLPENVTACVSVRSNSAFWAPPPKPARSYRGRPRKRGHRIGSVRELVASPDTRWRTLRLARDGQKQLLEIHSFDGVWFKVLSDQPVRVVIARHPTRDDRPTLAVLCTDHTLTPSEIVSRYADRWAIETAFAEAKGQLGVGEARNRVQPAVERTVPFGFLCRAIVILWYTLHGDVKADLDRRLKIAPWYRQKRAPAFADMLIALRRELIRAEFRHGLQSRPTRQKIEHLAVTTVGLAA